MNFSTQNSISPRVNTHQTIEHLVSKLNFANSNVNATAGFSLVQWKSICEVQLCWLLFGNSNFIFHVFNFKRTIEIFKLTFIVIFGGNCKDGMLDVLIFVNLSFVKCFVKIRWVIVLVGNTNANKFGD